MGQYRQAQITNAGLALIEQAQITEKALEFTALKTGNGEYTGEEDLKLCMDLKNAKNTFVITKVSQEEQKIKIASQITNENVPEGYSITEIGIFGQLDGGEETLIAITSSVNPDFLPATTVTPSTILVEIYLEVTNADDVEFTYTIPEGVYATLEDYEEQNVRLEEVDGKLKELDTPEYDISEQTNVEQLSSGESLKVALRKLAKAVADYISHKADQVVHITAEERTAWNAKLGAEDIANNTTTMSAGKVLDARQGKTLSDTIKNLTTTQEGSIQTNINWDTIKVPGLFRYILQASDGIYNAPALNIPFYLVVIKKDDNNLEQWAYSAVSNLHYTRVYASGEWGAWAKVLTNEDIVANLATDRSDMLLAASMGKNLQDQISTLNSNKLGYGTAAGTTSVLYTAYGKAGISRSSGVKTLVVVTDSDSMAYGVYIASYVHGSYLNLVNILNGGIQANAYNQIGTVSWTGQTGTPNTFVIPIA